MKRSVSTHKTTASNKVKSEAPKASAKAGKLGEYHGNTIHTGPQGGHYYINSHGNKIYIH